ncbi:hypothetical protein DN402_02800 [Streptomyces sp. SW4]|nr:hypothetical protein DN402_02800 [Streptomyces sp. SW4]
MPSIEVAEGQDRELAALVGRGHSLTDVVDLRTVPAYPCSLPGWRPYFSSGDGTADTSGSTLSYRVLGGGRLLALESVVSGDFVLPVRRHSLPGDAAARAVAELEELAAAAPRTCGSSRRTRPRKRPRFPRRSESSAQRSAAWAWRAAPPGPGPGTAFHRRRPGRPPHDRR